MKKQEARGGAGAEAEGGGEGSGKGGGGGGGGGEGGREERTNPRRPTTSARQSSSVVSRLRSSSCSRSPARSPARPRARSRQSQATWPLFLRAPTGWSLFSRTACMPGLSYGLTGHAHACARPASSTGKPSMHAVRENKRPKSLPPAMAPRRSVEKAP